MSKKIFFLGALLVFGFTQIKAQTLSVGPVIGLNASTIQNANENKTLTGLMIGGFGNYSINEHFGINAKLLYSQLGTKYSETFSTDIIRLHYLQLPLAAVYFFGDPGSKLRPKLFVGPYFGSLLRGENGVQNEILAADGESQYNKLDIGGQVGLGLNYRLKERIWLNMEATGSKSFTDLSKSTQHVYKNAALGLNVGVSFPVGKD